MRKLFLPALRAAQHTALQAALRSRPRPPSPPRQKKPTPPPPRVSRHFQSDANRTIVQK
ncbi:MAG: hypothetical protein LBT53_06405 [Puniceicoccales bacterium]|nr:hypothetical protein [Puniceicoccales bacterium]